MNKWKKYKEQKGSITKKQKEILKERSSNLTGGNDSSAPSADKRRTCLKPFSFKNLAPSCSTIT